MNSTILHYLGATGIIAIISAAALTGMGIDPARLAWLTPIPVAAVGALAGVAQAGKRYSDDAEEIR